MKDTYDMRFDVYGGEELDCGLLSYDAMVITVSDELSFPSSKEVIGSSEMLVTMTTWRRNPEDHNP
jgi:hypothetical protein